MTETERNLKIALLRDALELSYNIAEELELGNIFYNEGFAEFFLAQDLGHEWNKKTQGPDGFSDEGGAEYKMRSSPDGNFQFHWLSEKKMNRMKEEFTWAYFATRNRTHFTEVWRIPMSSLLPTLNESSVPTGGSGHRSYGLQELIDLGATQVR